METAKPRPPARSFEDLLVWQKAHQFVLQVYALTETFPKAELFGLTSQLRRAAVSIAANIASKKAEDRKLNPKAGIAGSGF